MVHESESDRRGRWRLGLTQVDSECNQYSDPCSEWAPYYQAGKPVLNAEYTPDGETTARFCSADTSAGITGALFDVNLNGSTYRPCAPVGPGGRQAGHGP